MLRIIGLLLLIPLLDALLLVVLVPFLGWQLVVLLVVLTALVGMLLVRLEGRHTLAKIQRKLVRGDPPTDELIDGGLLIAAGAFLLTPGLVTDILGFVFVIPLTRYPVRWALKRWVIVPYIDKQTGGFATGNVYVGGFPPRDGGGVGGAGTANGGSERPGGVGGSVSGDDGGGTGRDGDAVGGRDVRVDDVTDVEFEEVRDDETRR